MVNLHAAGSKPGITFIQANPCMQVHGDYFLLNDSMSTFEGSYIPSTSILDTITGYGKPFTGYHRLEAPKAEFSQITFFLVT